MNEKLCGKLRKVLKYKPGYKGRQYVTIPTGKKVWTGKERDQVVSVRTGGKRSCTGLRWEYLRSKDAIRETKRL